MKKVQKLLISALCLAMGACALTACGGDTEGEGKIKVTFYDATGTNSPSEMSVIKTVEIDSGATVEAFTPTKEGGYDFVNWFATPSKSHKFDFSEGITEDIGIYAGFSKYVEDTREYYIIGAGTSPVLLDGWGVINDAHKFTKAEGKNEYSLTLDLNVNDEFTLNSSVEYTAKRGAGYLVNYTLSDGTEVFEGKGSVYDDTNKGSNIKVKYAGNYTLKLTTHPNEDYYNTAGNGYTEDRKEIYNISPYDTIEWVRNGDVSSQTTVVTDYYIKGAQITGWGNLYNNDTKMQKGTNGYTLSVYLKAGDTFMFTSLNTSGGVSTPGAKNLKADILDEASRTYVGSTAGGDITATASGTYTFTYNEDEDVLSVTFDATALPETYDYYLDGSFGGTSWGAYQTATNIEDYKLVSVGGDEYKLQNVALEADDEITIRKHTAGSELTEGDYGVGQYNFAYLTGSGDNFVKPDGGTNIKVAVAGNYDVIFNSYSKTIKILPHNDSADVYDIYIKGTGITNAAGTASTWEHAFADGWKMTINADETAYEITVTIADGAEFGLAKYDKGASSGSGDFINTSKLGSTGDANEHFGTSGNFACATAGTYKIVYTIETEKVDFYSVQAQA